MSSRDARYWIEKLALEPHPEGGYFRETYRASLSVSNLPAAFHGARPASTAIYFLLQGSDFSALHRLASDELWHFHAGSTVAVHVIDPSGELREMRVGSDPEAGEVWQAAVPAGCWFGSSLVYPGTFALVGCTVAPGFDFADFEMARREELITAYPKHGALIERLTRPDAAPTVPGK